ncbi:MAG TPA: winged helix-turn-helix domain-containing protein [Streptosporangiaceae bacterium]|jgi:two-component system OmpR family response regulator|nr:winged helix-turn-helix domain-containing protein [Streptosporangiaceae bacterium]
MTQDGGVLSGRGEPREHAGQLRDQGAATLRAGDLELDLARWTVHQAGQAVDLSPTEFRLLVYLMRNQGRVLSREQILLNVWGEGAARQPQIVDTYVSYLRRKLDPPLIRTARGTGYVLGSAACAIS